MIGDSAQVPLEQQVLSLLGAGGFISTADLARRLGVSEELVRLMVADLERFGYLARAEAGCGRAGCGAASSCGPGSAPGALLSLTPKGRQAASRSAVLAKGDRFL